MKKDLIKNAEYVHLHHNFSSSPAMKKISWLERLNITCVEFRRVPAGPSSDLQTVADMVSACLRSQVWPLGKHSVQSIYYLWIILLHMRLQKYWRPTGLNRMQTKKLHHHGFWELVIHIWKLWRWITNQWIMGAVIKNGLVADLLIYMENRFTRMLSSRE